MRHPASRIAGHIDIWHLLQNSHPQPIDQIALLDDLPPTIVRRIGGVRLYSPNLRYVDLAAPGYYFLATDTPALMRWLAGRAVEAGRMLELADRWIAEADQSSAWSDPYERPTTLILRREAGAVVRPDSAFPADPFAGP